MACVDGTLKDNLPEFETQRKVLGVVVVSGGYPASYKKGCPITGKHICDKFSSLERRKQVGFFDDLYRLYVLWLFIPTNKHMLYNQFIKINTNSN